MSSFPAADTPDDALALLALASLKPDAIYAEDTGYASRPQQSLGLGEAGGDVGGQPGSQQQGEFDFLDLLDDDGFDLFGSPIAQDADLPSFGGLHGGFGADGLPEDVPYPVQGPSSPPHPVHVACVEQQQQPRRILPSAASSSGALSMNPAAMHFAPPAAPPPSPEYLPSSSNEAPTSIFPGNFPSSASDARRASPAASPQQHINAVAGPGPSSSAAARKHTQNSIITLDKGKKRSRSPAKHVAASRATDSRSPPPKRPKVPAQAKAPVRLDPPASVNSRSKKRARSVSSVEEPAPDPKGKGKDKVEAQRVLTLNERIAKAHRINATRAEIKRIVEAYDDDRRLLFHMQMFKLLTEYDPVPARTDGSAVFNDWVKRNDCDLATRVPEDWLDRAPPTLGDSRRWKTSSSRRAAAQRDALLQLMQPVPVPQAARADVDPVKPRQKASLPRLKVPKPLKVGEKGKGLAAKETRRATQEKGGATKEKRRISEPLHRHERPLSQPSSSAPTPGGAKTVSSHKQTSHAPKTKAKTRPTSPPKARPPATPTPQPEIIHRDGKNVPLAVEWGGNLSWNPAAPREAFVTLDSDDEIKDDAEVEEEKAYEREQLRLRKERAEKEAAEAQAELLRREKAKEEMRKAALEKRKEPPRKAVSKLGRVVAKRQDLAAAAQREKAAALVKDKGKAVGPSRLPPSHRSRLPPPQVSHRPKFTRTLYSDDSSSSDDNPPARMTGRSTQSGSRPRPKARLPKSRQIHRDGSPGPVAASRPSVAFNLPASPRSSSGPQIITIDDSDEEQGGSMEQPPASPSAATFGRPTISGKMPSAAFAPSIAQPVRLKLSLKGKTVASFTSTPSSSDHNMPVFWDRDAAFVSPPVSPIITAANLPPHSPIVYPLYTSENHLRELSEGNMPTLQAFLAGLNLLPPPDAEVEVVCLDDEDDVDKSPNQRVIWEASVRERVARARSFGRLDNGGAELQAEYEEENEWFEQNAVEGFPRSDGAPTTHDHLLVAVHMIQRSLLSHSRTHRRAATRIAEMIEEYWARKEGRDAKSLKELEKARKAGARKLAKEVRARWALAVELVHSKRRAEEEAEEQRRNQEELSELLERSQRLLAERRAVLAGEPSTSPEPAADDDDLEEASSDEEDEGFVDAFKQHWLSPPPASPSQEDQVDILQSPTIMPGQPSSETKPRMQYDFDNEPIELGDSDDSDDEIQVTSILLDGAIQFAPSNKVESDDDEVQILSPPPATAFVPPKAEPPSSPALALTRASARAAPPSSPVNVKPLSADLNASAVELPTSSKAPCVDSRAKLAPASPSQSSVTSSNEVPPKSESPDVEDPEHDAARAPRIPKPSLLRGELRPYQQTGLDWLASLYANEANGILADEMGLGKTIQTIALLAHLACDKGMWGPHLIIVPTSVLLNWDMEFKRFLPGFNVLPYYGSKKQRDSIRRGWAAEGAFEVCITSYQTAVADANVFKRKQWCYMVLDEAHNIKNFKSQKWTTLLTFNAERRLLLTGTPIQNNLQELWSLLYFIMPSEADLDGTAFANHKTFNEWFSSPLEKAIESGSVDHADSKGVVDQLHLILRPYILRRDKSQVEKQLPPKKEHVVYCRLSKRQRFLYDEFMSRSETRSKLASGSYIAIKNCLMQLRKVCNHPDLFETRPIRTSFVLFDAAVAADFEIKELLVRRRWLADGDALGLDSTRNFRLHPTSSLGMVNDGVRMLDQRSRPPSAAAQLDASQRIECLVPAPDKNRQPPVDTRTIDGWKRISAWREQQAAALHCRILSNLNSQKCQSRGRPSHQPLTIIRQLACDDRLTPVDNLAHTDGIAWPFGTALQKAVESYVHRAERLAAVIQQFAVIPPAVVAPDLVRLALPGIEPSDPLLYNPAFDSLHHSAVAHQIAFPDSWLIQYDCGKLQVLAKMLHDFKAGGHRCLIFTQWSSVLNILEIYLNLHGLRYLRLDGSTNVEQRQVLMEKFNMDDKIFAFIATTRSGGVGINLTGADVVIQYDCDWNPAMDKQAQDRAHRIGQTREVNVYRLVSERTVEENMLRKANQKRELDNIVINKGGFTTDYFNKMDWREAYSEFVEEALAAPVKSPEAASERWAGALAAGAAADEDEEEQLEDAEFGHQQHALNEDGFEADEDGRSSQRYKSAGQEEDEDEDEDGLEGVERLMVRWVEEDWESFC